MLSAAAALTPEELTRELGASFGSVRGTLLHIIWGERRWLQRWLDGAAVPDADVAAFPDVAALERVWLDLERDRAPFLASLTDAQLSRPLEVRDQQYALGDLVQHILNHSTYHRGQVTLLLRQLGHVPPATDYRLFLTVSRDESGNGRRS